MHEWPYNLPLMERTWSASSSMPVQVSQPERGPSRRRRLSTRGILEIKGTFSFTSRELDIFLDFWTNDLNMGMDDFLYPDHFERQEMRRTRFKTPSYEFKDNGDGTYTVSTTLELL